MEIFQIIIYICSLQTPVCQLETADVMILGPSMESEAACHAVAQDVLKETGPQFADTTAWYLCRSGLEHAS